MIYTLDKCEMIELMLGKNSSYKEEYLSILRIIEKPAADLLEFTKTNYPNYTDHTLQHSYRILRYLFPILGKKMKDSLTATEIFCLILSAMFHDIGMSNSTEGDKEKLRIEHGKFAVEPIRSFFNHLKIVNSIDRFVNCVSYVCESHTKDLQQLYKEHLFTRKDTINGEIVRYGYLTILLRVGDLMDMEEDRTSYIVRTVFPEYFQKDNSIKHHKRCEELINFNYSDKSIEATVETVDRENYKLWSNWFTYLKDEIIQANTYYFRDFVEGEGIPKFEYTIKPADGANFSTEEIRFEIDDKGALWEIISNSIYTAEYDFLRELSQNAIDACLMDCYLNKENVLQCAYQREWPTEDYCVHIMFSEELNILVVHDNGIGMDMNTLKKYLFKTADSGYRHINVERDFLFPAIAKFGIGFIACLTKAEDIKIFTQGVDAQEQIAVEIEKDSNLAFIERREKTEFHGTVIELKLKDRYTFISIQRYLQQYFCAPAVRIELIDLDVLEAADTSNIINGFDLNTLNSSLRKKNKYMKNLNSYYERIDIIRNIVSECDTLRATIFSINEDEVFPLNQMFQQHNTILHKLKDHPYLVSDDILQKYKKFQRNTIDKESENYKKLLSEIIDNLNTYQNNELDEYVNYYKNLITVIGSVRWEQLMDKEICIAYLNKEFKVADVACLIEPERMQNNVGIVFIKSDYNNPKLGIEFTIVNAFFFENGNMPTNILRVRGNDFIFTDNEESKIISLDEIYDMQYQLDLEFIEKEEEENYHRQIRNLEEEEYSYKVDVLYGEGSVKILKNVNSMSVDETSLNGGALFLSGDVCEKIDDITVIPKFSKSLFCQDGIKINANLSGLVPFKMGYYKCNFFGDSRFELNVTRHDINRDSSLINNWIKIYGKKIQKEVIENVVTKLKECGIKDINFKGNLKKADNNIFDVCAYKQFVEILSDSNLDISKL